MAKVTITIEDTGRGVKFVSTPSAEFLIKKIIAKEGTAAEGYAITVMKTVMRESMKKGKDNGLIKVGLPKLGVY